MLVTTEWLIDHLDDPDVRVVEVDEDTEAYGRGHIPGAVAVHWSNDLQDPLRRDFIDRNTFARLQIRLGITNDTTVVLYGGNNNWFAAYAYWYYKVYQHRDVRLLDGGRKLWELQGHKLVTEAPRTQPSHGYASGVPDLTIRAFRGQVEERVRTGGVALVDVRSPEEYRGEKLAPDHLPNEAAQRPGHIPGAVNVPWSKAADPETGRFLPVDRLRQLYGEAGVTEGRTSSRTAASANARRTPGSCCTSCSATRTSATTTGRGRSGAHSSAHRSNADPPTPQSAPTPAATSSTSTSATASSTRRPDTRAHTRRRPGVYALFYAQAGVRGAPLARGRTGVVVDGRTV